MSNQMCKQDGSRTHSRKAMTPRRNSLQLWTPKMKNRDERKRIMSMCLSKIKKIEDRDSCLLRSVLVTNILKKLQKESELESRLIPSATPSSSLSGSRTERPSTIDLDFDTDILNFNEFYLPPTPRMISSLEEDEVLELALRPMQKESPVPPIPVPEPVFERTLTDEETLEQLVSPVPSRITLSEVKAPESLKRPREESSDESGEKRPRVDNETTVVAVTPNEFESVERTLSCAQSSMFCDLHNAVFHGIMTSMES